MQPTQKQLETWSDVHMLARLDVPGEDEANGGRLKNRLLDFWMLLVAHQTGSRRYQSPLLSFCAMLSIKPSTKSWLEPGKFNSNLSAIIWVVQLLLFYDSARKEKLGEGETLAHVKRYCERFLQQTVETPMGEILRWRLLLFRISKDSVGDHEAFWDETEQVLTYEDVELHMDQIPTLLESEYRDCRRLLYNDLMFGVTDGHRMRAWASKDSANVDTVGWNFIQHRDNGHLLESADRVLLSTIERSDLLCRLYLTDHRPSSSGLAWRDSALAAYEVTVQEFLKRLSVLVHISGDQPVRESEFSSMTTQRRRSITLCHGRVMIHVKNHKGQQQTGRHKENIRFLPDPVGELLLDYLVYVMPLRQLFLRQQSPKALLSAVLWEKDGKVWTDGQLSRCLEGSCIRAGVPRLHIANWRQMTVAIVKTKFASQIGLFEADDDDEDAEELEDDVHARNGNLLEQGAVEAQDAWRESGLFDHGRDEIILYVRTCNDAESLAEMLGCDSYTAESGTPATKKAIPDRWVQTPDVPYIVATTALAGGFDYPYVRLVLNIDEPESLVIFAQESGRAGLDGQLAYSMVLLPATWKPQIASDAATDVHGEKCYKDDPSLRKGHEKRAVHRYLQSEQCYRTSLTEHLDLALHRRWCIPEDVPCDVCRTAHQDPIRPVDTVQHGALHTGLDLIQQERLRAPTELGQYRLDLAS
ncbi:hypothetical protein LTS02_018101, partial [Friedmanniomyces endolithicus]